MFDQPGQYDSNNPQSAGWTGNPAGQGKPLGPQKQLNPNVSPLHDLITPQCTVPFGCNQLPGASADASWATSVGYFGLQYVSGATHGVIKLCGYNLEVGSTFNSFDGVTVFPVAPDWSGGGNQIATYGNLMGTGAGVVVIHSADLPQSIAPRLGAWCKGPALAPFLQPSTGTFTQGQDNNQQISAHCFAPGSQSLGFAQTKTIALRDTPLGWDVNKGQGVWVLVAIDGATLQNLGDSANVIYAFVQGTLICASASRRFTLSN